MEFDYLIPLTKRPCPSSKLATGSIWDCLDDKKFQWGSVRRMGRYLGPSYILLSRYKHTCRYILLCWARFCLSDGRDNISYSVKNFSLKFFKILPFCKHTMCKYVIPINFYISHKSACCSLNLSYGTIRSGRDLLYEYRGYSIIFSIRHLLQSPYPHEQALKRSAFQLVPFCVYIS